MAIPVPDDLDDSVDRAVIRFDPGGPIDLEGLGASFAALARFYARHFHGKSDSEETKPRLFITRLENGSIVAEVVPYIMMFGQAVQFADQAMIIADFTRRTGAAIKAFAGEPPIDVVLPNQEDGRDIREFLRPLTGRRGSNLQISYAKFHQKDGEKETILEYKFDETEINRAALAIDSTLDRRGIEQATEGPPSVDRRSEVMLFFQQASRGPGKKSGRTADKAVIPSISDKPLPVYFREDALELKDEMVHGDENPLTNTFVVDVDVQLVDSEPKGYVVTRVHQVISPA